MKHLFISIVALSLFILSSCNQSKETIITGQTIGNVDKVIYSNPNQSTCFPGFRDTIQVDKNGNFELRFNLKAPAFIQIWSSGSQKEYKFLIEPNNNYNILIDSEKGTEILGENEAGNRLYSTLPNPPFIEMEIGKELREENSLAIIREKIQDMKSEEIVKFQQLFDENKISSSFFEAIKKDRDCYYASLESRISQLKTYRFPDEDKKYILENGDDLLENLKNIYTQYSPDNKDLLLSSFWAEYAEKFIWDYLLFADENLSVENLREFHTNGTIHTFHINNAKKHLTGNSLEFFQATYMYSSAIQKRYEKELVSLFEQFKKDYPDSQYSKYLQPLIDAIVDFHNKTEQDFNEDITFVKNFENINAFEDLIESIKGKKIYIDVWATWCGPCKQELNHSKELHPILREKDIQMLYISIDKESNDEQWKKMIKYYDLKGKHIRANENLSKELYFLYDGSGKISIPWYILIDEEGNILQKHAKKPSQIVSEGTIN